MKTLSNETNMSLVEVATILAQDHFYDTAIETPRDAMLAPVMFDNDGTPVLGIDFVQTGCDIYELLDNVVTDKKFNHYAVFTTGWACPRNDDEDIAPSQHPERKRVQLLHITSRDGVSASAMRMGYETELMLDDGKAQGSLAEAMLDIFA